MLDIYVISKSYSVIVKLINWVLLVSPSRSRSVTNTQRISDSPIISDWMHHHPGFVCLFENKLQLASEVNFFSMMINAELILKNNWTPGSISTQQRMIQDLLWIHPLLQNFYFPIHGTTGSASSLIISADTSLFLIHKILIHSLSENGLAPPAIDCL